MAEKTVWIIGAGSDIAAEFLKKYGGRFGNVALAGRDTEKLNKTVEKYNIGNASVHCLDLNDGESVASFLNEAPSPDAVVNFAGYVPFCGESGYSAEEIQKAFSANAVGIITVAEAVAEKMKSKRDGVIVNLGSCSAVRGRAANRIYSAGKSAAENYFQGLAQECSGYGVRVIDVRLGRVDTKMLRSSSHKSEAFVISAEKAADIVYRAIEKDKTRVYYQRCWRFLSFAYGLIPDCLYNRFKF